MNSRLVDVAPYEIRVRGRLDENWFGCLDQVTMTFDPAPEGPGVTTLVGNFDQAALRGLLSHLWDMNLTVLGVDPRDAVMTTTTVSDRDAGAQDS
jgi:hypothetical protein